MLNAKVLESHRVHPSLCEGRLRCNPLTDRQNVSLAVFEPRRLGAACGRDAVHGCDPRHVVFLKDHASGLQVTDFGATSSTAQNAVLAFDVPAPADGYMNTQEPLPHS